MTDFQRSDVSLFWYWINERHAIYLRRREGKPKPWTDDKILQEYKFTNVFRELDTGTVWLRENFLEPHRDDDLSLILFNICWYRWFNLVATGKLLGWCRWWDLEKVKDTLHAVRGSVFTGAHIINSQPGMSKIDFIARGCYRIWEQRHEILDVVVATNSLQATFTRLLLFYRLGPFLAYEMVSDMRHTRLLESATDIMTWANAGPGAIRGLERLGLPAKPARAANESMRWLLDRSLTERGAYVPEMEMRDIEHSLCETDKYIRVMNGEGRPRSKYNGGS